MWEIWSITIFLLPKSTDKFDIASAVAHVEEGKLINFFICYTVRPRLAAAIGVTT